MKITIAASIRLLFILTLVAISVAAQTGLIEQGQATLDRGDSDTAIENLETVAAHNSGKSSHWLGRQCQHARACALPEMSITTL